jgi:hypothetical protein
VPPEKGLAIVQAKAAKFALAAKPTGRTGRLSSPTPSAATGIDYDELPGATDVDKSKLSSPQRYHSPTEVTRTRGAILIGMVSTRASAVPRKGEKLRCPPSATAKEGGNFRAKRAPKADDIKASSVKVTDPQENKRVTRSKMKKSDPKVDFSLTLIYVSPSLLTRASRGI